MQRLTDLSRYSQFLLLVLVVMVSVFAVIYPVTISREGYLYREHLLIPTTENGSTVYSAKVKGQQWRITVTADKTVTFQFGDKQYGPYTAKEDPTAIPKGNGMAHLMTGVEVREGNEIIFRGGIYDTGAFWTMINEDGSDAGFDMYTSNVNGELIDGDGNIIDPIEPVISSILKLMQGPKLTHRGHGGFWFLGAFLALLAALEILFADELFQLKFIFIARDPEFIEPSDWTLFMRPISFTVSVIAVLVMFLIGLK